eukprot:236848-Pleurochrysis_carterae.AAC.1
MMIPAAMVLGGCAGRRARGPQRRGGARGARAAAAAAAPRRLRGDAARRDAGAGAHRLHLSQEQTVRLASSAHLSRIGSAVCASGVGGAAAWSRRNRG